MGPHEKRGAGGRHLGGEAGGGDLQLHFAEDGPLLVALAELALAHHGGEAGQELELGGGALGGGAGGHLGRGVEQPLAQAALLHTRPGTEAAEVEVGQRGAAEDGEVLLLQEGHEVIDGLHLGGICGEAALLLTLHLHLLAGVGHVGDGPLQPEGGDLLLGGEAFGGLGALGLLLPLLGGLGLGPAGGGGIDLGIEHEALELGEPGLQALHGLAALELGGGLRGLLQVLEGALHEELLAIDGIETVGGFQLGEVRLGGREAGRGLLGQVGLHGHQGLQGRTHLEGAGVALEVAQLMAGQGGPVQHEGELPLAGTQLVEGRVGGCRSLGGGGGGRGCGRGILGGRRSRRGLGLGGFLSGQQPRGQGKGDPGAHMASSRAGWWGHYRPADRGCEGRFPNRGFPGAGVRRSPRRPAGPRPP